MLLWCTGISGSGRKAYVSEAAEEYRRLGGTCKVIDIGDLLDKVPDHIKVGATNTALLDGNEDLLRLYRLVALQELNAEVERAQDDLIIVSTHACFMRRSRIMSGLDMHFIKQNFSGKIDAFATVIHDCHDTWLTLQKRPEWRDHLTLAELAVWRDFEMTMTRMLAEYEAKPFYLMARRDPARGLAQLALSPPSPESVLELSNYCYSESESKASCGGEDACRSSSGRGFRGI